MRTRQEGHFDGGLHWCWSQAQRVEVCVAAVDRTTASIVTPRDGGPVDRCYGADCSGRAPCTVDGADQRGMLPPGSRRIGTELFHVKRRALPSLDTTGIDPRSEANDPRESGCPSPLAPASCGGHPSVSTHCPTLLLALRSVRCSARPSCPRSAGRSLLPPQVTCHLRSSSWCRVTDLRRACGTAPRASQGYRQRRRQRACSQVRAWVSPQVCKGMSTPRPGC